MEDGLRELLDSLVEAIENLNERLKIIEGELAEIHSKPVITSRAAKVESEKLSLNPHTSIWNPLTTETMQRACDCVLSDWQRVKRELGV